VKSRGWIQSHRGPDPVGDEGVDGDSFVHFVEVRQRLVAPKDSRAVAAPHRRTVGVVEQPFGDVRRGYEVLQALLVLDADTIETEVITYPEGSDVHGELLT